MTLSMFRPSLRSQAIGGVLGAMRLLTGEAQAQLFVSNYRTNVVTEHTLALGLVNGGFASLERPSNLHFGPDGRLYVGSDTAIRVFDGRTGAYIGDFAQDRAYDFVFDPAGNLFAVDGVRVAMYGPDGSLLRTYDESTRST